MRFLALLAATALASTASASTSNFSKLPLGFDLTKSFNLEHVGPCNASQPYVPPSGVLALCDSLAGCVSTNYIPVQPGTTDKCAWLKTAGGGASPVVSFVHTTRCTATLTGITNTTASGHRFKYCPKVGDAFYDVLNTIKGNLTSYDECTGYCEASSSCAACVTDGHDCTLLATHSKGGYDSWFRLDF